MEEERSGRPGASPCWRCAGRRPRGPAAPSAGPTPGAQGANATFVGREKCAPCHAEEDRRWKGSHHDLAMQEATRKDGPRQLRQRVVHALRRHVDLLQEGREVLRPDRRPGRQAPRVPDRVHVRRVPPPAVPDRLSGRAIPGAQRLLGHALREGGRAALVPPLPERGSRPRRPAPLDRAVPELELHVRRMPFDEREEGLLRRVGHLRDDLVGDRRFLRGLPRPGLGARRVGRGRQGREGEERGRGQGHGGRAEGPDEGRVGLRHEDRRREAQRPAHLADRDRDLRALPRAALGRRRRVRLRPAAHADAPAGPPVAGNVFRRRPDRGRGLRVRLLPPEQDAHGRRDLLQLPRSRTT